MIERCENPNNASYKNYGGRGIKVCKKWRKDFTAFCRWARSNGYDPKLSIDRIDNDKGYSPNNCRWADSKTQARNRRNNRIIEYNGESKAASEWAEICGLNPKTFRNRLDAGWSVEDALTIPLGKHNPNIPRTTNWPITTNRPKTIDSPMASNISQKNETTQHTPTQYTPTDIATLLRIRVSTAYELIKSGDLPALRIGKNYKVPKVAFDKWLSDKTMEQTKERRKHDTA